jgi:hypothetical protein
MLGTGAVMSTCMLCTGAVVSTRMLGAGGSGALWGKRVRDTRVPWIARDEQLEQRRAVVVVLGREEALLDALRVQALHSPAGVKEAGQRGDLQRDLDHLAAHHRDGVAQHGAPLQRGEGLCELVGRLEDEGKSFKFKFKFAATAMHCTVALALAAFAFSAVAVSAFSVSSAAVATTTDAVLGTTSAVLGSASAVLGTASGAVSTTTGAVGLGAVLGTVSAPTTKIASAVVGTWAEAGGRIVSENGRGTCAIRGNSSPSEALKR